MAAERSAGEPACSPAPRICGCPSEHQTAVGHLQCPGAAADTQRDMTARTLRLADGLNAANRDGARSLILAYAQAYGGSWHELSIDPEGAVGGPLEARFRADVLARRRVSSRKLFAITECVLDPRIMEDLSIFANWAPSSLLADAWRTPGKSALEAADGESLLFFPVDQNEAQWLRDHARDFGLPLE